MTEGQNESSVRLLGGSALLVVVGGGLVVAAQVDYQAGGVVAHNIPRKTFGEECPRLAFVDDQQNKRKHYNSDSQEFNSTHCCEIGQVLAQSRVTRWILS